MQQTIFKALNVIVAVSTSEKLNKELLRTQFEIVSLPKTCGYDEELLKNRIPERKTWKFLEIAKSTTELIQPLDTYGFHILDLTFRLDD